MLIDDERDCVQFRCSLSTNKVILKCILDLLRQGAFSPHLVTGLSLSLTLSLLVFLCLCTTHKLSKSLVCFCAYACGWMYLCHNIMCSKLFIEVWLVFIQSTDCTLPHCYNHRPVAKTQFPGKSPQPDQQHGCDVKHVAAAFIFQHAHQQTL